MINLNYIFQQTISIKSLTTQASPKVTVYVPEEYTPEKSVLANLIPFMKHSTSEGAADSPLIAKPVCPPVAVISLVALY